MPSGVTRWIAALFASGSACFLVASVASQWASTSRPAIGVVFFVGSLLFTAAAYLQHGIANAGTSLGAVCFLIGAILRVPEATATSPRRRSGS